MFLSLIANATSERNILHVHEGNRDDVAKLVLADVSNLLYTNLIACDKFINKRVRKKENVGWFEQLSLEIVVFIFAIALFETITQLWTNKKTNMTHNLYKKQKLTT